MGSGQRETHTDMVEANGTTELLQIKAQLQQEIIARQQAEQALKQSKEQFQIIFEQARTALDESLARFELAVSASCDGIWDARFFWEDQNQPREEVYYSPRLLELLGLNKSDLSTSRDYISRIHPEDCNYVESTLANHLHQRLPYQDVEYRVRKKSGEYLWVSARGQAQWNEAGQVTRFAGSIRDIQERKTLETELAAQQVLLKSFITYAPVGLSIIDNQMRFVQINQALAEMNGPSVEEHIGQALSEVIPHLAPLLEPAFRQVLTTGEPIVNLEASGITPPNSGIWRTWVTSRFPIPNTNGVPVAVGTVVIDITERKQAEIALRDREQFLASIYEGVEYSIFMVDVQEDGNFHYAGWNPSAEVYTGMSSDAGYGKTPEEIFPPLIAKQMRQQYTICLEAGGSISFEHCLSVTNQEIWQIVTLNPLRQPDGKIYRIIGTSNNITGRKLAEQALQRKTQQLEQALQELKKTQTQLIQAEKMSSLGQLVAGIAHEINNPVSFIYGNVTHASQYIQDLLELIQVYQKQYPQPVAEITEKIQSIELDFLVEDLEKILTSIKLGATRIQEIVRSLRSFSRLGEADLKLVSLHEGIENTLLILEHRLKAKADHPPIQVIKQYDSLPLVECYAGLLNQVFMNLLVNAIDALEEVQHQSNQNHPELFICIRTEIIDGKRIVIRIADNGPGIPESVQQRLFEPFFTTKPVGKGTGLGLAISYQIIVEKHSGLLYCDSTLGKGTEFVIEIPIQQSNKRKFCKLSS